MVGELSEAILDVLGKLQPVLGVQVFEFLFGQGAVRALSDLGAFDLLSARDGFL
jgi:hypothetical protein